VTGIVRHLHGRTVTAVTCGARLPADNRLHSLDATMTGSNAAFQFPLGQPDRDGPRGLPAWRRGWARLHRVRTRVNAGVPVAVAPVVARRDDSVWTEQEQQFLRALREAGL
jgi:hypothetical protein